MEKIIEEFREMWGSHPERFVHGEVRAWTGTDSEGYRVLTALLESIG
jgi:hypothetical protein